MIRRTLSLGFLVWFLGLTWFAIFLPQPANVSIKTDAVVVLTGGPGRLQRGIEIVSAGEAKRMMVSGVDPSVRRAELEEAVNIPRKLSRCCIDLDKASVDTISNARETARWLAGHEYKSVRLVTSDWHLLRAELELRHSVDGSVKIVGDAVPSSFSLTQLFMEYNKLLARFIALEIGGRF